MSIIDKLTEIGAQPNPILGSLKPEEILQTLQETNSERFSRRFKFTELFREAERKEKIQAVEHAKSYKKSLTSFLDLGLINKGDINDKNEVAGLYCFYENGRPIYFGNSRKVFTRLRQHFLGQDHNTASLVYLMARTYREGLSENERPEWNGVRKDFPDFDKYRLVLQQHMIQNWEIAFEPMSNAHERYLSEVYYAMHFKTYWNNFDTH